MSEQFVHRSTPTSGGDADAHVDEWIIGNDRFELTISTDATGIPVISKVLRAGADVNWAANAGERAFGPVVEVNGEVYRPGSTGMQFSGAGITGAAGEILTHPVSESHPALRLNYTCSNGLHVCHHLSPSSHHAVWRAWTTITNATDTPIGGITRFDALNLRMGVSGAEPQSAYLLGWLDTPRADAPGRPPTPFRFTGWIPKLMYGDRPPTILPPPEAGWSTPTLRLITERLTRLPLRSGKRGTYDNHPWVTILDPGRNVGFFVGLEWSGTWKMDIVHDQDGHVVSVFACTDTCTHTLRPGESLTSPPAFVGLCEGDWDKAFNACRSYVRDEILPPPPKDFPFVHYVMFPGALTMAPPMYYPDLDDVRRRVRALVDAAADTGAESFLLDSMWWSASALQGDFSIGLGDFAVDPRRFPDGLKVLSDYVHSKRMVFGLWFEFERVDIRTANTGRNPWRPEWLVHQNGYPYRSWCQHVFMLCLGVRAAAEWALENLSWAVSEYGVDWFMIDSNEWAVCTDPTHDHGEGDGEWAQIQGLYSILRGLRERFPRLIIDNGAGGSQRGDFGMARLCDVMPCSDINVPSTINRQYSHGYGAIYPVYYARQGVYYYPTRETGPMSRTDPTSFTEPYNPLMIEPDLTPERSEWRMLNRLMGVFQPIFDFGVLPQEHLHILKKVTATYKKLRPTLYGDRYVLTPPPVIVERENREHDGWEVYEHLSLDRRLVSVFFFRCRSPEAEHHVRLRGLDPSATYRAEFHTGRPGSVYTGEQLVEQGFVCRLERPRSAEIMILHRL